MIERFEELAKQPSLVLDDEEPPMGRLMRSNSQTITNREIKIVETKVRKTWEDESMTRKSRIAMAIIFIGSRLSSMAHVSPEQLAVEDFDPKKKSAGRSLSFSLKSKGSLLRGSSRTSLFDQMKTIKHSDCKGKYLFNSS